MTNYFRINKSEHELIPATLAEMVQYHPEWAISRIRFLEWEVNSLKGTVLGKQERINKLKERCLVRAERNK